jgi:hypothetical protein
MPAPQFLCLLTLFGRQHGIELTPGAGDDGVQLRLHLAPDCPKLAAPPVHDRVYSLLLVGGEAELPGKAPPEFPVARRMSSWSMFEAVTGTRSQHQPVQSDSCETAGQGSKQEYHDRPFAPGRACSGLSGSAHWLTASSNNQSPGSGATR